MMAQQYYSGYILWNNLYYKIWNKPGVPANEREARHDDLPNRGNIVHLAEVPSFFFFLVDWNWNVGLA